MASPYKDTLNLPKTDFPMKSSPADQKKRIDDEKKQYAQWIDEKRYEKLLDVKRQRYIIHDGPPFANGDIHIGHVLNKVLKDVDMRFRRLQGMCVQYRPGWDCHGLPIENKVKQEFKKQKFDAPHDDASLMAACASEARYWLDEQRRQFQRLGILGDWDNPYFTMSNHYETKVVDVYNVLKRKGLVYKAVRPVHWSVENQTALALAELEYKTVKTVAWYVAFHLHNSSIDESLLVWTTTPWSLPGNVAVAVNPDISYVCVQHGDKFYWVAEFCKDRLFTGVRVVDSTRGINLLGKKYEHPFTKAVCPVAAADFVTANEGTGLVHIAPAHGKDDYQLALKENIEVYNPIGTDARFKDDVALVQLRGQKVWDGEKVIRTYLQNQIVREETIEHEYPHDWRSGKPTITIATEQSFVALDTPFDNGGTLREKAISALDNVEFYPPEGKQKLIKTLRARPDWCISRQRVWGINIPGEKDIFDVWFESGCSWTQIDEVADTYLEGVDQYRGWFQHSLLLSVAVRGCAPFKRVVDHGFIVKPDGTKVSKSDAEYVPAKETLAQLGADPIRLWVCSNDFHKDVCASPQMVMLFVDKYNKIRNTVRYLISNLYDFNGTFESAPDDSLDGWVRAKTLELLTEMMAAYGSYEYHKAFQTVFNYCNQTVSAIYANAMKDRLYCSEADSVERRRAQTSMMLIYDVLVQVLDPMVPYLCDECRTVLKPSQLTLHCGVTDTWNTVFALREQGLLALDRLKKEQGVNKATDAMVVWRLKDVDKFTKYDVDLADIFGCGYHTVESTSGSETVEVRDTRNLYRSCDRCWKRVPNIQDDGLCDRCRKAVSRIRS